MIGALTTHISKFVRFSSPLSADRRQIFHHQHFIIILVFKNLIASAPSNLNRPMLLPQNAKIQKEVESVSVIFKKQNIHIKKALLAFIHKRGKGEVFFSQKGGGGRQRLRRSE